MEWNKRVPAFLVPWECIKKMWVPLFAIDAPRVNLQVKSTKHRARSVKMGHIQMGNDLNRRAVGAARDGTAKYLDLFTVNFESVNAAHPEDSTRSHSTILFQLSIYLHGIVNIVHLVTFKNRMAESLVNLAVGDSCLRKGVQFVV